MSMTSEARFDDGPVGLLTWIDVQEPHSGNRLYGVGHLFDHCGVTAFGDVGNTLDDTVHQTLAFS
jgi:hypothetical protein